MKDECQRYLQNGPLQPGDVVVTPGGNSKWGCIIHAVCPTANSTEYDPSATLQQVILASLREADTPPATVSMYASAGSQPLPVSSRRRQTAVV